MPTVAFLSQKGGVGKSTVARALAIEAARAGLSVHLADLDVNQGTTLDWHRDRLASGLQPAPPVQLHPTLQDALRMGDRVDLLVLDTAGRASTDTLPVARAADLVVIPAGAGLDDLRPGVRLANSLTKGAVPLSRLIFALTRISTEAEAEAARGYLSEAGYQVATGYLPERAGYRVSQNQGRAVTEATHTSLRTAALAVIQSLIDALPSEDAQ